MGYCTPPILLLGSGRSGTTFLGKLFDSHPQVLYRHEPDIALPDPSLPFQPSLAEIVQYRPQAARYLASLARTRTARVSAKLPLFPKSYRSPLSQRLFAAAAFTLKSLDRLPAAGLVGRIPVPDLIRQDALPHVRVVIKSVNSLGRARLFAEAAPQLSLVHIIRHPCGLVASLLRGMRQGLMQGDVFINSLFALPDTARYGWTADEIRQLPLEQQLAFQWMVQNDKVLREMQGRPGYRLVRYEDLCTAPSATIRELFAHCGLEASEETLAFLDDLEETETSGSHYFSVMRPPRQQAFAWQQEMPADMVRRIIDMVSGSLSGELYADTSEIRERRARRG